MSPAQSVHRRPGRILLSLILALAFIGIAGCSGASGGTATSTSQAPTTTMPVEVRKGGVLSIAVPNLPASWSPAGPAWSTSEYQAARAIYDRLMVRDQNDKPVGELIERIIPNSTFTAWTLDLRKGITFSDGTPLDAVTVAANLNLQRLAPAASDLLKQVIFVTAPSELTVVVATAVVAGAGVGVVEPADDLQLVTQRRERLERETRQCDQPPRREVPRCAT